MEGVIRKGSHAVVIPMPGQGHINPMMHLSRWLQSHANMSITFINTQYNHDRIIKSLHGRSQEEEEEEEEDGAQEREKGKMRMVGISDGLPPDMPRSVYNASMAVAFNMGAHFEALLQGLLHTRDDFPPITCIIFDLFMPFVPDLAIKYGIPSIAFWTQSASAFACHLAIAKGFMIPREIQNSKGKDIVDILGVIPMQFDDFPTFLRASDPDDFLFKLCVTPFTRLHETTCILINTSIVLEPNCLQKIYEDYDHIFTIGPVLPREYLLDVHNSIESIGTSFWEEDASCMPWLDSQATGSVLYISFDSIAILTMEQIEEFAWGLEASHVPLLWVIRHDLVGGEASIFPKGFVERMEDRLQFVPWAPQLEVLSHKAIGGFLTHCGWNSTMESIVRKVPMLCWPYFADQPLDRRLIVDLWNVGLEFVANKDGVVAREEVEVKVKALMHKEGKHIRNRKQNLGECVKLSASEGNGSSNLEFNTFLEVLHGLSEPEK